MYGNGNGLSVILKPELARRAGERAARHVMPSPERELVANLGKFRKHPIEKHPLRARASLFNSATIFPEARFCHATPLTMSSTAEEAKEKLKEEASNAAKSATSSLRDFTAGGVGGICAVIVGHPFDLVKVRLQTAEKGVYTGALDVVRKTIAREGLARVCGLETEWRTQIGSSCDR